VVSAWPTAGVRNRPVTPVRDPLDPTSATRAAPSRVSRSASAVLRVRHPIASRFVAKPLVTTLGAGTGTRTPGLLITSNLKLSGVLTGPIVHDTRIALEREPPSYQLSWRAARRRSCPQPSAQQSPIPPRGL
jgi:hypothetical protein